MDKLDEVVFYNMAKALWDNCWDDTTKMIEDVRGKEIVRQMIRSVGSIAANIEEGYGRGYGKEYPQFLRIARGSARESKGWYNRSKFLLAENIIENRVQTIDSIIAMLNKSIQTLEQKIKDGKNYKK